MSYFLIFVIFAIFIISNIMTAIIASSIVRKSSAMVIADMSLAFIELTNKYGIDSSEEVISLINSLIEKYKKEASNK